MVSVKGGCLRGLDWATAIHIWTKSAMLPIPEGSEAISEEPTESDYSSSGSSHEGLDQPGPLMGSGGYEEPVVPLPEVERLGPVRGACELSGI